MGNGFVWKMMSYIGMLAQNAKSVFQKQSMGMTLGQIIAQTAAQKWIWEMMGNDR